MFLNDFFSKKTIKLNDSYTVTVFNNKQRSKYNTNNSANVDINWDEYGDYKDKESDLLMFNCSSFTLPNYKFKLEEVKFGNNTQQIVIPDYENESVLEIILTETSSLHASDFLNFMIRRNIKEAGLLTYQEYIINGWLDQLNINIFNNNLNKIVQTYHFEKLKLIDYAIYGLDYDNDAPVEISLKLSFEVYTKIKE